MSERPGRHVREDRQEFHSGELPTTTRLPGHHISPRPCVVISNSCPIRQQLMSTAVGLKPVLPIFQALAWRIIHISLRIWTSIADKGCFWTSITDMFSAQLAARCGA
jgi:hypothetical protein